MIRRATVDRLRELMPLVEEFYSSSKFLVKFDSDHCAGMWTKFMTIGAGVIFLLEENEKIIGFLAALKWPDINSGDLWATGMAWFVKSNKRSKGILLLKEFERWAKEENCKMIIMAHLMDLMPDKMKKVYGKFGYQPTEINYGKVI